MLQIKQKTTKKMLAVLEIDPMTLNYNMENKMCEKAL